MNAFPLSARSLLVSLGLLTLCQCGRESTPLEEAPAVGVLRTTSHEFTLHAGPNGTLYTVRDKSGRELVRLVPADVLAVKHPELNEDLKGLHAGSAIPKSTIYPALDHAPNRLDIDDMRPAK